MRSVLKAFQGHVRTFHLVLYDFAFDAGRDSALLTSRTAQLAPEALRLAQTPTWLNFSQRNTTAAPGKHHRHTSHPDLRYAVHSELFHLPSDTNGAAAASELEAEGTEWRAKALPSFNSMSIESRLGWIPGLAETSIAMNDDFFILRPHSVRQRHS